jgi:hypothetical protein
MPEREREQERRRQRVTREREQKTKECINKNKAKKRKICKARKESPTNKASNLSQAISLSLSLGYLGASCTKSTAGTSELARWLVSYHRRGSKGGRSRREPGLVSEGAQSAPFRS